ncbi:MAG: hypothetical protein AAGI23_08425 [Bacteroidota bacterium]
MNFIKFFLVIILISTVSISIYFVGVNFFFEQSSFGFSPESKEDSIALGRIIIMGIATVMGIFSKILFEEIEKSKDFKFSIWDTTKKTISSRNFWLVLLASPVILLGLYSAVEKIDNMILVGLTAYQNGFFFKSIVKDNDKD